MLLGFGLCPSSTESAIANGDTRTIVLSSGHTNESGSFTYMVDGVYDQATLDKLNWFLRDWRLNEPTKMDPKLFDIVWEVYRESGSKQPIDVLSGYRSPQTNAMLRRRSRQVAKYSQHMEGKAMDAHFQDVDTATIRDIAMRMEAGGVGFYPTGYTPWVHIDSGDVRYWPRMSRDALARLFPDGKTVFVPATASRCRATTRRGPKSKRAAAKCRSPRSDNAARLAADCSPGCSARNPAAPTTRKRRAASKPRRPRAAAVFRAAPAAAQVASADAPREAAASAAAPQPTPTAVAEADRQRRDRRRRSERRRFPRAAAAAQAGRTDPRRRADAAGAADRTGLRPGGRHLRRPRSHRRPAGSRRPAARHHPRRRRAARNPGADRGRRARTAGPPGDPRPRRRARRAAAAAPRRTPARVAAKPDAERDVGGDAGQGRRDDARRRRERPRARPLSPAPVANPYGDLVTEGFAVGAAPTPLTATADLRGATP